MVHVEIKNKCFSCVGPTSASQHWYNPPVTGGMFRNATWKERAHREFDEDINYCLSAAADGNPRVIRTFEDTPREEGELTAGFSLFGRRLSLSSHERPTRYGRFRLGLGASRFRDDRSGDSTTEVTGFVQWGME